MDHNADRGRCENIHGRARQISRHHLHRTPLAVLEPGDCVFARVTDGFVAERVIREWITFYNADRPHTALDKRTPDEAYFDGKELKKAA